MLLGCVLQRINERGDDWFTSCLLSYHFVLSGQIKERIYETLFLLISSEAKDITSSIDIYDKIEKTQIMFFVLSFFYNVLI